MGLLMGVNVYATAAAPSIRPTNSDDQASSNTFEDRLLFADSFDDDQSSLELYGSAAVQDGALVLDGSSGGYAQLTDDDLLADQTELTVSFDVKTESGTNTYFTFAIGQDRNKYLFVKTEPNYFRTSITQNTWSGESTAGANLSESASGVWKNVTVTLSEDTLSLYVDGALLAEKAPINATLQDLGDNPLIYFGKSLYAEDGYFKGSYDNVKIYSGAMTADEVSQAYEDSLGDTFAVTVEGGTADVETARVGDTVTVTADPAPEGKVFVGWSGDGITFADPAAETTTFTMPRGAVTVSAVYESTVAREDLVFSEYFHATPDSRLTLHGSAKVDSGALVLDGASGGYASLDSAVISGEEMTVSFDVKTQLSSGNFFTFAMGQDTNRYLFLRTRATEFYVGITQNSWQNESGVTAYLDESAVGQWKNVTIVLTPNKLQLYIDGVLMGTNDNLNANLSDLGEDMDIYFGQSFYSGDAYFNGAYDNIKVYDRALTQLEIARIHDTQLEYLVNDVTVGVMPQGTERGLDEHNTVSCSLEDGVLTSQLKKYTYDVETNTMSLTDLTKVPVTMELVDDAVTVTVDGQPFTSGDVLDLTQDRTVEVSYEGMTQTFTIKTPELVTNSVLPGQFADPDIDKFGDKYWIFPTTDGYSGWSGTQFYAFSSDSLSGPWQCEGMILETNSDATETQTNTVHDYEVPVSEWSYGSAWAPSIEEKDGKYYFYYCAKKSNGESAIGVAVADDPAGPYTPASEPLITMDMCRSAGISMGQAIDPSVFTDDDGTSYLYFGNGDAAVVELGEDMMSVVPGTLQNLRETDGSGLTGFRESVTVEKVGDLYHFLWSQDDTGSPNYCVQYGVSTSPTGPVQYKYLLMDKDEDGGMLGTAHQSILVDDDGRVYLAYHRFYTPLNLYTSGLGYHRETCVQETGFDSYGYMLPMEPTMEGTDADPLPQPPEPDYSGNLEETDGVLTLTGNTQLVDDGNGGSMLHLTTGWNNSGVGQAQINGISDMLRSGSFSLVLDVNQDYVGKGGGSDDMISQYDRKHIFTIGTASQYFGVRMFDDLGENAALTVKNNGEVQTIDMNGLGVLDEWESVAIVYTETDTTGVVSVYANGVELLAPTQLGFKLSDLDAFTSNAYLGRCYDTNYIFSGYLDQINLAMGEDTLTAEDAQAVTAERAIARDAAALSIPNLDRVKGNITLPAVGEAGSTITWTSSNPDVITDRDMDGKAAGVVTRPAADESAVSVTLTAVVSNPATEETVTRTFTATVLPVDGNLDTDYTGDYLWTYFQASGGYEKIFLGTSEDGLNWTSLNNDQPILANLESDLGVRDPHLIRSAEGDRYWILGTDLHAEGGGAGGSGWNQRNASQSIVVWESEDLVHWSEGTIVHSGFDFAGCVWAPEAIYDEATGQYLIYWSARDQRQANTNDWALRVYVCTTRDFQTFSEPVVWLDEDDPNGGEVNIIDSSIVYNEADGYYYRFSTSDWNTVVDRCKTLSLEMNDWERVIARGEHTQFGITDGMEGITCYQLPDGTWCVMGDNGGYRAFVTEDFTSYTKVSSTFSPASFRHGTVIRLSEAETARIQAAYGENGSVGEAHNITVSGGWANVGSAEAGDTVTITVNQLSDNQTFTGWVGEGVEFADATAATTTFVMPDHDVVITAQVETETPAVDKSLLQETYEEALSYDTSNLIPMVADFYQKALDQAKAVLDDPNATTDEVWDAWDNLVLAIQLLDFTKADKDMLELLLDRAETMMDNADKYVSDHWQLLVDARADAQTVYDDPNALDSDVQPVADALLDAILAQRFKADKSILEDLLNQAESINLEGYTADSVAAFRSALSYAQTVMADATISQDDQDVVDDAVALLTAAMDGLTAEGETQPSDQPENTDKPEASQKPEATAKPENVPQTGDNNQVLLYVAALGGAAALMAGMAAAKRKERQGK